MSSTSANRHKKRRGGAAVAELAILLPLIAMLVFAAIECANMVFVNQSVSIAGYEGARVAIQPTATNTEVLQRCNDILTNRQIQGATISINPPNVTSVANGQHIAITVSAPCNDNNVMTSWFFQDKTISTSVTMAKE